MSKIPSRTISRDSDDHLQHTLDEIREGMLDDYLIDIIEAINERREALKERVDKLVESVYGEGYAVQSKAQTSRVPVPVGAQRSVQQAAPSLPPGVKVDADLVSTNIEISEDPTAPLDEVVEGDFPEPIVSGHIFERINNGQMPSMSPVEPPIIGEE